MAQTWTDNPGLIIPQIIELGLLSNLCAGHALHHRQASYIIKAFPYFRTIINTPPIDSTDTDYQIKAQLQQKSKEPALTAKKNTFNYFSEM